jgi:thiol-disulfide isomerase/thioredoxin
MNFLKIAFFYFILILLQSCNNAKNYNARGAITIELSDNLYNRLKGSYMYLFESTRKTDSVLVNNKIMTFKSSMLKSIEPIQVMIRYYDLRNGNNYFLPLGFKYKSSHQYIVYSSFYADHTSTYIKAFDINGKNESYFIGSNQNIPRFEKAYLRYPGKDSIKNYKIRKHNISLIEKYPNSIVLLEQLYDYKEFFPLSEIKLLLTKFNNEVLSFELYNKLQFYIENFNEFNQKYPSFISFENQNGTSETVDSTFKKLHLIVFWASWCGPCRKEIPELLKLHQQYSSKGLTITSISIDSERNNWKNALEQEKMPWQQLLAIDSSKQLLEKNYSIKAIPKSFLFDDNKKLIRTYDGYDTSIVNTFNKLLIKYL